MTVSVCLRFRHVDQIGNVTYRALMLLAGWHEGHPACKKNLGKLVVRCWHGYLFGVRRRLAYDPDDAVATHCLQSRLVLTSWYWLTRVVPDKGPLNRCLFVCVTR